MMLHLSDDEFIKKMEDAALITNRDEVKVILAEIENDIAKIQSQIDCYTIEANAHNGPMSEGRQDWLRRAAYALAMKKNDRHRVMQRDKEFRGIKITQIAKKDPGEGLAKQARLMEEAAAKKSEAKARHAEAIERSASAKLFMKVAQEKLPQLTFDEISAEVKRLRKLMADAS